MYDYLDFYSIYEDKISFLNLRQEGAGIWLSGYDSTWEAHMPYQSAWDKVPPTLRTQLPTNVDGRQKVMA